MAHHYASALEIAESVQEGNLDPVDLVESFLDRIHARNDRTNAYVTIIDDLAIAQAEEIRTRVENGEYLPLAGVPVAIKDLSDAKAGVPFTKGLQPLADNIAESSSVGVQRLEAAGGIVLGTTNTPELGHRVRTDNLLVGPTGTPFDPDRNAGGSSGGSAAALADGLCTLATGSDVGGSLRNPASCCNLVSVKPTHGLVPRGSQFNGYRGHTPVAVAGPMARDVQSLARMLDVLAGKHQIDPFSVHPPESYEPAVTEQIDPANLSLAYSPGLDLFPVAPVVQDSIESTLSDLEGEGASVTEVSIDGPARTEVNQAYMVTVTTFFATGVRELDLEFETDFLDTYAEGLPEQLTELVEVGESHALTDYTDADLIRTELYYAIESVLDKYDALMCPTLATPPLSHDEPFPETINGEETNGMPTDWTLAWPFNLTGHPVVHVPAAPVDGLPVGMQIVGKPFAERQLLEIASAVELSSPWSYPDD